MVINDIHDDAQPGAVHRLYHFLELPDAGGGIVGVARIGAFRHVVVLGVIAPVVGPFPLGKAFVNRAEIEGWQEVYMGYPQVPDMFQAGQQTFGADSTSLGQAPVFAGEAAPGGRVRG